MQRVQNRLAQYFEACDWKYNVGFSCNYNFTGINPDALKKSQQPQGPRQCVRAAEVFHGGNNEAMEDTVAIVHDLGKVISRFSLHIQKLLYVFALYGYDDAVEWLNMEEEKARELLDRIIDICTSKFKKMGYL